MGIVSFNAFGKQTTSVNENLCYFKYTYDTIFAISNAKYFQEKCEQQVYEVWFLQVWEKEIR